MVQYNMQAKTTNAKLFISVYFIGLHTWAKEVNKSA
jgi:hypothetical protein